MFGEHDMHTETESEDGGVALSMFEPSDEMETDHESAPTSASPSPIHSAMSAVNNTNAISPSVGGSSVQSPPPQSMQSEASSEGGLSNSASLYSQFTTSITSPIGPSWHEDSFAQALSGELMNVSTVTSTPEEGGTANLSSETLATTHPLSTITSTPIQLSGLQGEAGGPESSNNEQLQSPDQQPPDHDAIPSEGTYLLNPISLPTLTDAFGSDFLTQTNGSSQAYIANDTDNADMQEEYSEYWDEIEDCTKNLQCEGFFNHWKSMYAHGIPGYPPISEKARNVQKDKTPDKVLAEDTDLRMDNPPDLQGIYWSRFQTTKEEAREVRRMTYSNHVNDTEEHMYYSSRLVSNLGAFGTKDYKMSFSDKNIPSFDKHFDFRETNMKFSSYISHFQLRHNLFASSKNALFYTRRPSRGNGYGAYVDLGHNIEAKVNCFNPETSADECVMDFSKRLDRDMPKIFRPSTLSAGNGILVVGSFEGAYAMKSLSTDFDAKPTMGIITDNGPDDSTSTNHIQSFLERRSGLPQVAFSSNDKTIRVLDCTTNRFTTVHRFVYPVNSSATSPDGRLRLFVGDDCLPIIANAETGEEITKLRGHTNFGFACDWAPDGVTMATGHQDGFVRVWDARNLSQSTHSLPMEMAGSRTLQFSPLGSGKRVLVIAEPGDFVHIVDAQTFQSKQVIDFFGEIAGISMPPDGSALYIANQDPTYGGLIELERSRDRGAVRDYRRPKQRPPGGVDPSQREDEFGVHHLPGQWRPSNTGEHSTYDWLPDEELDDHPQCVLSRAQRHRRGLGLRELII